MIGHPDRRTATVTFCPEFKLTELTQRPTGDRPAAARLYGGRERRIGDCKIGAGQGPWGACEHARAVRGRAVANRRPPVQDRRRSRAHVDMLRRAGRAQPGRARSAVVYPGHLLATR